MHLWGPPLRAAMNEREGVTGTEPMKKKMAERQHVIIMFETRKINARMHTKYMSAPLKTCCSYIIWRFLGQFGKHIMLDDKWTTFEMNLIFFLFISFSDLKPKYK